MLFVCAGAAIVVLNINYGTLTPCFMGYAYALPPTVADSLEIGLEDLLEKLRPRRRNSRRNSIQVS